MHKPVTLKVETLYGIGCEYVGPSDIVTDHSDALLAYKCSKSLLYSSVLLLIIVL